jgi:drug/metabolite transporter superfamily protein YnfA
MKWLPFLAFFAIALAIVFGCHAYAWLRLIRDPAWPAPWGAVGTAVLAVLAVFLPLSLYASRNLLPPAIGDPVAVAAFVWMGTGFLLVTVLLGLDVLRGLAQLVQTLWAAAGGAPPLDPARP